MRIYNEAHKTNDKFDNLSYNEYKRSGCDYFELPKKYFNNLIDVMNKQVEMKVNLRRYDDQIVLDNILLETFGNLENVFSRRYNNTFYKLSNILQTNKTLATYEENHLKVVDEYLAYLNFAYFSKDFSRSHFNILQKILNEKYKGNVSLLNQLLNKYGYVNKERALVKIN